MLGCLNGTCTSSIDQQIVKQNVQRAHTQSVFMWLFCLFNYLNHIFILMNVFFFTYVASNICHTSVSLFLRLTSCIGFYSKMPPTSPVRFISCSKEYMSGLTINWNLNLTTCVRGGNKAVLISECVVFH